MSVYSVVSSKSFIHSTKPVFPGIITFAFCLQVLKTKGNACKMVGLRYNKELKVYYEAPRSSTEEIQNYYDSKNKKRKNSSYE